MKKLLLLILLLVPFSASAVSVGWDRFVSGGLRTYYAGDKVLIGATATTSTANLEVIGNTYTSGTSSLSGFSLAGDGDGALTFQAVGNLSNENLILNLDDTSNTATWSSGTGVALIEWPSITHQASVYKTSGSGSETLPTYSFSADPNTGIYKTSAGDANSISITTNGTQRVVVDASGNMGVATSAPVARLEAWGASSGTIFNLFTNTGTKILEVLNTGVATVLGSWDFGGATSLEIPNGSAPAVDTLGEIGLDTTDNQLLVATGTTPAVIPTTQRIWSGTVASTSIDFVSGGRIPLPMQRDGFTLTEIHCWVESGTSVVINIDTEAGGANTDTLTCTTSGATDTAQSANYLKTADSLNVLEIGTITGAVDYVSFSVWGTWTRE